MSVEHLSLTLPLFLSPLPPSFLPPSSGASVVVILVHAVFLSVPESSSPDPELEGIVLEDVTVS